MKMDIAGKTAVITGGSSGLGAACVEAFAAEGAKVIFTGMNKERGDLFCEKTLAVCPGSMRTPMYDGVADSIGSEKCEKLFADRYPMGRIAEPSEVASVILFLCSASASYINGVNLPVDGGLSAHSNQPDFS